MSTLNASNIKNASSSTNNIVLNADGTVTLSGLSTSSFATYSNIIGVTTVGIATSGSSAVTLIGSELANSIANGDTVTGAGVAPGTVVSSGAGTVSLVLSGSVGLTSSFNPLTFYSSTKPVSAGSIGGQLCRAWVNFKGTGTVAIRASYNVSSITDNEVGDYTVNFTTAMPDANYSIVLSGHQNTNTADVLIICQIKNSTTYNSLTTGSARVSALNGTDPIDPLVFCADIFR